MQKKRNILFDLDGTLTDPMLGITKSIRYALGFFGIQVDSLESLCPFIGPPLAPALQEAYGFSEEQAREALAKYREYFGETGLFENEVYPGIPELLADLKAQGRRLYLATSKPTVYAERILVHFGLDGSIDFVGGAELSGERVHKPDVIEYVLEKNNLQREDCVMVGDRKFDVEGGRGAGLATIGVLYGYGSAEELAAAAPDRLAGTVADLGNLLL